MSRPAYSDDPANARQITEIRLALRAPRKDVAPPSYASVARKLNADGIPAPGGGQWTGRSVKAAADRQNIKKARPKNKRPRKHNLNPGDYLTIEQQGMVLRACSARDSLIVEVLLGSGLRPSVEFCQLQLRDLAVFQGHQEIFVRQGKRKVSRTVQVSNELARKLRIHRLRLGKLGHNRTDPVFRSRTGAPLCYETLRKRMGKLGVKSGVGRLHCYRFRHSFGTNTYRDTKDLKSLAEQMGHKSIQVTQMYVHVASSAIIESANRVQEQINEAKGTDNIHKPAPEP
jgi:integrase